jgi:hypothetical protein
MTENGKSVERVTFSRSYDVCMMAIDGTWRRNCQLSAISEDDAVLNVEGSIQGLNLKEFFLLLSSTGLAYRRCELVRVNGTEMGIQFLKGRHRTTRSLVLATKLASVPILTFGLTGFGEPVLLLVR